MRNMTLAATVTAFVLFVGQPRAEDVPARQVYVEYRLAGNFLPASANQAVTKLWRAGTKYARVESSVRGKGLAIPVTIISEPDVFIVDPSGKRSKHVSDPDPNGQVHIPVLFFSQNERMRALEIGREMEFFRDHHAAKADDETVDGADCAVFSMPLGDVMASLYVDRTARSPKLLTFESNGREMRVEYLKYDRKQRFDPALYRNPGTATEEIELPTRAIDTPFDDIQVPRIHFLASDVRRDFRFSENACADRPTLLAFYDPADEAGQRAERLLESLWHRYKETQLCFVAAPRGVKGWSAADGAKPRASGDEMPIYELLNYEGAPAGTFDHIWEARHPRVLLFDRRNNQRDIDVESGDENAADALVNAAIFDGTPESDLRAEDLLAQIDRVDGEGQVRGEFERLRNLLRDERFDEIDRLLDRYRAEKARFPTGGYRLYGLYRRLSDFGPREADFEPFNAKLQRWIDARPRSPAPHILRARALTNYAYMGRGTASADGTSRRQFAVFSKRLALARKDLEEAESLDTKDPEVYVEFIRAARGDVPSRADVDEWLKKGRAIDPAYHYLYVMMFYYLDPKWNGEPGEAERFLMESADEQGELGAEMVARVLDFRLAEGDFGTFPTQAFRNTGLSWAKARHGFERILRRSPSKVILNDFAAFACAAGDRKTAKGLLAKIGDDYAVRVWQNRSVFEHARRWAETKPPEDRNEEER